MLYHYIASETDGRLVEADFDADSLGQVLQFLGTKGLRPVSVEPIKGSTSKFTLFRGSITVADKVFLTKYLALMLRVGTDLLSAINILIADFDKPAIRDLLLEIRENLSRGQPFYQAFERHPKSFSPVFINLVKAAEQSGNLQATFEDLSKSLQAEAQLRSKVRAALIYPIILVVVATGVVLFLVMFALPKVADAFSQTGINPPIFSRIVFGVGLYIGAHIVTISIVFVAVAAFSIYFFWKNRVGKRILGQVLQHLPVARKVYREIAIQQFASTFSSLIKAGLPILKTITITAEVVGADEFRVSLLRIANEGLAKGLTIGEAFRRETVFPKVVTNLVAISERAGHLEEVMGTLSEFYAANVESDVQSLVAFLEPMLLLAMGLVVGGIALSVIVPVYQLTSQF
jgi:type IV pilus assembly protein PilC